VLRVDPDLTPVLPSRLLVAAGHPTYRRQRGDDLALHAGRRTVGERRTIRALECQPGRHVVPLTHGGPALLDRGEGDPRSLFRGRERRFEIPLRFLEPPDVGQQEGPAHERSHEPRLVVVVAELLRRNGE